MPTIKFNANRIITHSYIHLLLKLAMEPLAIKVRAVLSPLRFTLSHTILVDEEPNS